MDDEKLLSERPGPYFIPDQVDEVELVRLHLMDGLPSARMGGLLPEQEDLSRMQRVLDVGCGTGGWLIRAAKTYDFKLLVKRTNDHFFLSPGRSHFSLKSARNYAGDTICNDILVELVE